MVRAIPLGCVVVLALCVASPARAGEPPLDVELVVSGLSEPTWVTALPGDRRLFVLEQWTGRVVIVKDGQVLPDPFLDLGGQLSGGSERGLLGLAFHPQFAAHGGFYVTYNNTAGDIVLARYTVDPHDADRALAGSGTVLLSIPKPYPQHNGGMVAFGPHDGLLYLSTGDGGFFNDPLQSGQDLGSLLGKILRLDVGAAAPYAIPADNPFVGVPGARGEIFAYGLRNPWRFAFDRENGNLYIGDVGQAQREEIDVIRGESPGGQNFGWRCLEGTECTGLSGCSCSLPTTVPPIHEYDHDEGCAVIGGRVYRGDRIPGLRGAYLFADYCTNKVWSLRNTGGDVTVLDHSTELTPGGGSLGLVASIGEDGFGELLIVGHSGVIHRVVPAADVPDCDDDGTPDAAEIASGAAFDVNANDLPDSCELLLTGSDVTVGQVATFEVIGAQPGQPLAWFASLRGIGLGGPCFFDGDVCLDLIPMVGPGLTSNLLLLAVTNADAVGRGSLAALVPPAAATQPLVALQVLFLPGPLDDPPANKSNAIQKVVQGGFVIDPL